MDFQNRVGSKPGSAGVAGYSETNNDRRERLRRLALETIDLAKDPYFMRNHLGSYECKLCLTIHLNEGSYLSHTQAKKHQTNLARRAAKDSTELSKLQPLINSQNNISIKKNLIKIGRPGYKVNKLHDSQNRQVGLLFTIYYPDISLDVIPCNRFMSSFEQKIEPPNKAYQYLLVAAEPYETIAFKLQSKEIDRDANYYFNHWDDHLKQFSIQFFFKSDRPGLINTSNGPIPR